MRITHKPVGDTIDVSVLSKNRWHYHECRCCKSISNWLVVSSSEQLVLRGDSAVEGGVGSLCWGLDKKTEGLDEGRNRAHYVPRYFGVHHARVHGVSHHTQNCRQRDAVRLRVFSQTGWCFAQPDALDSNLTLKHWHKMQGSTRKHQSTFRIHGTNIPVDS